MRACVVKLPSVYSLLNRCGQQIGSTTIKAPFKKQELWDVSQVEVFCVIDPNHQVAQHLAGTVVGCIGGGT
jgi:hypothetical protein